MNRPYAEILMYSGACHLDPRVELTEEQFIKIEKMMTDLSEPFTGTPYYGTGVLSATSYMVVFPENSGIYVFDNGKVDIYTNVYGEEKSYQDTVGLHEYLKELLMPALIKHGEDMQKELDAYNEKMFGISKEEKV